VVEFAPVYHCPTKIDNREDALNVAHGLYVDRTTATMRHRLADNVEQKPAEDRPVSEEQKDKKASTKLPRSGKRAQGNAPCFDLRSELYRISGVDLTRSKRESR
jgi:hypothetical protein